MRRGWIAVAALALLSSAIVADATWSAARLRDAGTADWGLADAMLREQGIEPTRVVSTLLALDPARVDGVIVRVGEVVPTAAESDAVAAFAASGGRAIVLADPALAERFGMEIAPAPIHATDGSPLRAHGASAALLPGAMPLLGTGEIAVSTQAASFVDADADGRASAGDVAGPFPVGRRAEEGRVIVLSSPGLLDPEPLEDEATRAFVRDILAEHFPPGSRVAIDVSRSDAGSAPLAAAVRAGELPWLRGALVVAALAVGVALWPPQSAASERGVIVTPLREEVP